MKKGTRFDVGDTIKISVNKISTIPTAIGIVTAISYSYSDIYLEYATTSGLHTIVFNSLRGYWTINYTKIEVTVRMG